MSKLEQSFITEVLNFFFVCCSRYPSVQVRVLSRGAIVHQATDRRIAPLAKQC